MFIFCMNLPLTDSEEDDDAEHGQECGDDHADHHTEFPGVFVLLRPASVLSGLQGRILGLLAGACSEPVMQKRSLLRHGDEGRDPDGPSASRETPKCSR